MRYDMGNGRQWEVTPVEREEGTYRFVRTQGDDPAPLADFTMGGKPAQVLIDGLWVAHMKANEVKRTDT